MQHLRILTFGLTLATMPLAACGRSHSDRSSQSSGDVAPSSYSAPTTTSAPSNTAAAPVDTAPKHHSKLAGAALGAAAGHVLGHHAVAGAAVGALVQHERNKHP